MQEKISPETLVRFAISGCEDAKIVASIAWVVIILKFKLLVNNS